MRTVLQRSLAVVTVFLLACSGTPAPSSSATGAAPATTSSSTPIAVASPDPLVVETTSGRVRGALKGRMRTFVGVPYAAPPVGALRWKAPQPPATWSDVRDASQDKPVCVQANQRHASSEDCLFVEVYTPADVGPRRPVIVYIHGGGLTEGCMGQCGEPAPLVDAGAVVVMIAYRLGVFGFLAHAALDAESPTLTSGNYGLLDQVAALRWVRSNIAHFGGDPNNVTLLGGSSGGFAIRILMTSPPAKGLFHKAIVSSGSRREVKTLADREPRAVPLIARAGCPDQTAVCMRALPVAKLLEIHNVISDPVIDGSLVTGPVRSAIAIGAFERIPILEGTTRDEGRLDMATREWSTGKVMSASDYESAVARISNRGYRPSEVAAIVAKYPLSAFESASLGAAKIETDGQYACRARSSAQASSTHATTYLYRFDGEIWPLPRGSLMAQPLSFPLGAHHGVDLTYVISSRFAPATLPSPEQLALRAGIVSAYVTFARTGAPRAEWKAYSSTTDEAMVFSYAAPHGAPSTSFAKEHDCAWWEAQPWWPD